MLIDSDRKIIILVLAQSEACLLVQINPNYAPLLDITIKPHHHNIINVPGVKQKQSQTIYTKYVFKNCRVHVRGYRLVTHSNS